MLEEVLPEVEVELGGVPPVVSFSSNSEIITKNQLFVTKMKINKK